MTANLFVDKESSSLPTQTAALTDPRTRSANAPTSDHHDGTCRDFVWGICSKGSGCKYRHELHLETMKSILKFCHDYQNRMGCSRPGCSYLHTSNEEENLFLTTGAIPRVLQDRYAAMSSIPNNMFMNDMYNTQPPPPPPPPPSTVTSPGATPPAPLPTLLAPPPPPPPLTVATTPVQQAPATFTAPPHATTTSTTVYPVSRQQDPLVLFDARKPPPPLPTVPTAGTNGTRKRPGDHIQAGPCKFKKSEEPKIENSLCEKCVQRELRLEVFQKELHRLECEKELQTFIYESKKETYENSLLLLKSAVSPELCRILEEYIESSSQPMQMTDILSQYNQRSSFNSGPSNTPRHLFLQMMDLARNIVDPAPRSSNLFENDANVTIQTFLDMVKNYSRTTANAVTRSPQPPAIPSTSAMQSAPMPSTSSGVALPTAAAHAPNGAYVPQTHQNVIHAHKAHPPTVAHPQNVPQAYTQQHAQNVTHAQNATHTQSHAQNVNRTQTTAHLQVAMHPQNIAHSQSVTQAQSVQSAMPPAAASAAYMPHPYQAAMPPPPRPYYPQYAPNHNNYPNASYNMHARPGAPAQPQPRSSTSAAAHLNAYPYSTGRYPLSNYYPLHQ